VLKNEMDDGFNCIVYESHILTALSIGVTHHANTQMFSMSCSCFDIRQRLERVAIGKNIVQASGPLRQTCSVMVVGMIAVVQILLTGSKEMAKTLWSITKAFELDGKHHTQSS